ncbi:hypothetical protein LSH36_583g02032 [Paralvinella palmiformis]|uniref:threonine--tRNA ligase n=1 Tax=Paralvinella palmiformis TaxID=53620 RepID=A0AAD9MXQ2_9ANNE|nr:hypothetical protein LSH36_583g02032 [Paralvinella palmiformis]
MAEAVISFFPSAKTAIGPPIQDGFYYDFELPRALEEGDLLDIEEKMKNILQKKYAFLSQTVSREEAHELFADQPYKLEILNDLPEGETITIYTVDCFTDLCRGPHVENTEQIQPQAFRLLSVAGAYWRGDERNTMLQRIYATAWENKEQLDIHLARLKEVAKRDHRVLGKVLDLFSIHDESGPGLVYWHPKGGRIRTIIEDFWRKEHYKNGYELLYTPHTGKSWLWQQSGHLDYYSENMYPPMQMDRMDYYIKPMNCPFHIMIYKTKTRSYHELPLRWGELGTVYRYERSGVLHGLFRVRGFTQDDAHIFCTPAQVYDEIVEVLRFSLSIWNAFGFSDITAYLATRPTKSVGKGERWDTATKALEKALTSQNIPFQIDEGGGAFYGPKIDLKIKDVLQREWQMTTIQFDFNLPERFQMTFVDADGKEKQPYMIHRALLGSFERFLGILIEHYAGAFPLWLAPVQVAIIPVAQPFFSYASSIKDVLQSEELRVFLDLGNDRMGAKIRKARLERIPLQIIVGEQEQSTNTVSYRDRQNKQHTNISVDLFIDLLKEKIMHKEVL